MRIGRRAWTFAVPLALLLAVPASPVSSATAAPNVFSVRLQGWAVQSTISSTSTAVVPGAGYSFAKVNSTPALDGAGARDLDMAAIGANGQDEGLPGVVLFTAGGSLPNGSSAIPGYAEAFFPTFEGKSAVSEKCAANQHEAKETPECRQQPGPYAYAQVFDDQAKPGAVGQARNGGDDGGGETSTLSQIAPTDDGTIQSVQRNVGRDVGVPGTPITVESFLAESLVTATTEGVTATGQCTATVSVGGQEVASNRELQQALGPFSTSTGVRVTYVEPTAPAVAQKPDGGVEISCRGPQLVVFAPIQGGTGTTYTYGRTFTAAGKPADRQAPGALGGSVDDILGGSPATGAVPPAPSEASAGSTGQEAVDPAQDGGASGEAGTDVAAQPAALIEQPIELLPIGAWTALAATTLPLTVWLLLGVTGSLARGSTRLRLPPFRSP